MRHVRDTDRELAWHTVSFDAFFLASSCTEHFSANHINPLTRLEPEYSCPELPLYLLPPRNRHTTRHQSNAVPVALTISRVRGIRLSSSAVIIPVSIVTEVAIAEARTKRSSHSPSAPARLGRMLPMRLSNITRGWQKWRARSMREETRIIDIGLQDAKPPDRVRR